jgi:hypothetical protein
MERNTPIHNQNVTKLLKNVFKNVSNCLQNKKKRKEMKTYFYTCNSPQHFILCCNYCEICALKLSTHFLDKIKTSHWRKNQNKYS